MLSLLRLRKAKRGDKILESNLKLDCPLCSSIATPLVSSTDRNRNTTDQVFDYYRCDSCGLVFMSPIPDDLVPFYRDGYSTIPRTYAELREIAKPEEYRMTPILKHKTGGKLLEIGPWTGKFSSNAKEAGFEVTAIEMDRQCVDFLNAIVGVRAIQSSDPASTLKQMEEQFDVIALWHCLEHLRSPWLVLRLAALRLAPGGLLLVAMPNIESYEFSLLGADWRNLDAPRHLYFFPARLLVKLCADLGLAKLEVTTNDQLSRAFSKETWQIVGRRLVPIRFLRAILAIVLQSLANRREQREDSGPGMTAIFQRSAASTKPR